jgi:plastocyanin
VFKFKSASEKITYIMSEKKYINHSLLSIALFFSFLLPVNFVWGSEYTISIPYGVSNPDLKTSFDPASIDVKVGDKITWINMDEMMHSIKGIKTNSQDEFDSGVMHLGQKFILTVDSVGEYNYFCVFHPFMEGKISVT